MADYEKILNTSWDNVPKDKVLPEGSWLLRGKNATFQKSQSEGMSDRFLFVYQVQEAMDDVPETALAELGPDYDPKTKQVFFTIWVERPRDWDAVRAHFQKHGIDVSTGTIQDSIKAFKGAEVLAYLGTKTFQAKSGETVTDNDPTNFTPVA